MTIKQASLGSITPDINSIISSASTRYGVSSDLITAVILKESNGNPNAVSSANAQGLMQLMPSTAQSLGVTNIFDPVQNINAGTQYLAMLINKYQGDISKALAAYNFGPGNVDKGKSWPSETVNYVSNILSQIGDAVGITGSDFIANPFASTSSDASNSYTDADTINNSMAIDSSLWIIAGVGILALAILVY